MTVEQQLRALLEAEVADLEPSPTAWDAIRRGVQTRRQRWLLRRAAPAAAGLAVLGLVAAIMIPRAGDGGLRPDDGPTSTVSPAPSPVPGVMPGRFVAVRDGVLGVYRTSDGTQVRALTEQQPGGGAYDASIAGSGDAVVYAQGEGTCSAGIRRVPLAGGQPVQLVPADRGAASAPATSGRWLSYALTRCRQGGTQVDLILRSLDTGAETVIDTVDGATAGFLAPSWTREGDRLAVVVGNGMRAGGAAEVRVYEPGLAQHARILPRETCGITAVTWQQAAGGARRLVTAQYCGPAGAREARLYVAYTEEDGSGAGLSTSPLLTRGDVPVVGLDIDPSGKYLLGAQAIRNRGIEMWHWDFSGNPVYVPAPANLLHPTW